MDWNDVRHFLALARQGSVRAAGASLRVSHSTVARRVEALEAELSARLFDRTRDGYVLTEAGQKMLPCAERIELEMAALERGLAGDDERLCGTVSLTCCDSFVSGIFMPALRELCLGNPEIELEFIIDSRSFDLTKREADLALRVLGKDQDPPGFLIGSKLAPVIVCSYVATAHEDRLDPERPGSDPRWIGFQDRRVADVMIARCSYPQVPIWGAFSSLEVALQAAKAGLGLLMVPTYIGDGDPALRRLAKPDLRHLADLWLLSHPDLRGNARLSAARRCVTRGLAPQRWLFTGAGRPNDATGGHEFATRRDDRPDVS
ncbi:MAG: LysR family transcriptional regulator [Myxococcales bacterium]|nr:LysR family transcriptional regulator [Myxococcales bacterium]